MPAIVAQDGLLIQHYLDLQQYEKALPLLREALASDPLNGKWHFKWADVHYRLRRYEDVDVESHFQEALRLGHSPLQTYFMLGVFYQALGRYDRAKESFMEAMRLHPHHAEVMAAYAYLLRLMGKKKEAKRMIDEAMRLSPGNPQVLNNYVNIQLKEWSKRKRMHAMQMRIESGGSETTKLRVMALYEIERKRYHAAREHYRQAYLLDPLDRKSLNGLYLTNLCCHPLLLPWRWMNRIRNVRGGLVFCLVLSLVLGDLGKLWHWYELVNICSAIFPFFFIYVLIASRVVKSLNAKNEKKNRESVHLHG